MVLAGVLKPLLQTVNMVSAPAVAKERGIKVEETRREQQGAYENYIRVTLITERQERGVAGTVFGDSKPRIIQIKGINMEAELGENMLYITNQTNQASSVALVPCLASRSSTSRPLTLAAKWLVTMPLRSSRSMVRSAMPLSRKSKRWKASYRPRRSNSAFENQRVSLVKCMAYARPGRLGAGILVSDRRFEGRIQLKRAIRLSISRSLEAFTWLKGRFGTRIPQSNCL